MTEPDSTEADPRKWHAKKRFIIPGALLGLLVIVFLWAVIRGTWADAEAATPTSPEEGVVCQLHLTPEGRKVIRCAAVFDVPPEAVWSVITDYEGFGETFGRVAAPTVSREPDGRHHLTYNVDTPVGRWVVDVRIRHEKSPGRHVASWDDSSDEFTVNRGSWTLTPHEPGGTLVVFTNDVEVAGLPNFITRNALLSTLGPVVATAGEAARHRGATP